MKRLTSVLRWLATALALLVIAAACALWVAERSGWLRERVQREIARELGHDVAIDGLRLAWFEPAVELEGLRLRAAEHLVHVERARVALAWAGWRAPRVARVDVDGGRLRLCAELFELVERTRPAAAKPGAVRARAPVVVIEGLLIELDHPAWGQIELGLVDALGSQSPEGRIDVEGRLLPSFAADEGGAQHEIFVTGTLQPRGPVELRAWAASIPVAERAFPAATPLAPLRDWQPRAELSFDVRVRYDASAEHALSGESRARLAHGSFQPPTRSARVADIELDLDARCRPSAVAELLDPRSWESTARARAVWDERECEAWAIAGSNAGEGLAARAWLEVPCLPLSRDLLELFGLGDNRIAAASWHALEPRGDAHLVIGVAWPAEAAADLSRASVPRTSLEIELDGAAGITVNGWPSRGRTEGFPLPVEQISGRVVALHEPRSAFDTHIAIVRVLGAHSGGSPAEQPAFAEGLLRWPMLHASEPALDLRFGAHAVPIDARVRAALAGLHGTDFIAASYAPDGGHASIAARIVKLDHVRIPTTQIDLDFFAAGATWNELPVPVRDIDGRLSILIDPPHGAGIGFDLRGETHYGAGVRIQGRVEDDPAPELAGPDWHARRIQAFEVAVDDFGLRGQDRDRVVTSQPDIGAALDQLGPEQGEERGPQGKVDVVFRGATLESGGPFAWSVEVAPRGEMQFVPHPFPVQWRNVRGRVIVLGEHALGVAAGPPQGSARVVPFVGDWPSQARVACVADLPFDGERSIALFGAGIDVKNKSLLGAFRELFQRYDSVSLDALQVGGRVDLTGELRLPRAAPLATVGAYHVRLRDNDVSLGEPNPATGGAERRRGLERMNGILVQKGDELRGERITAVLGTTPITLAATRFHEHDGEFRLDTDVAASALPLDEAHLNFFLDPATVAALLSELALRGQVEIERGHLSIRFPSDTRGDRVEFAGQLSAREAFVDVGLPLSIEAAAIEVERLVYEGEHVRVDAAVRGLDGRVADRVLTGADLRFTYVEPHLSILELDGALEGGRLRHLPGRGAESSTAFSMDLQQPFPFDLAVRIDDVDVQGFLRGLFESDFASSGSLSGELRLSGDLERVTGIAGDGQLEMHNTVLWSIPVVREMLAQLGIDDVAVFERVRARFRVQDGQVRTSDLRVYSKLLELVGSGSLDFDGTLHHDLEVRYSLIDRLGPLRRLLYWVQNNLLRVAIRGDMSRPRVEIKGVLGWMGGENGAEHALPLPGFTPLSARF